ncbi:ATP-binding protein [Paludibaculum fermentans]|uniref:ATP-binding protein n=1 Tax=Paludibaculum fermentans TaxID=1473598 RepID=UPI003EC063EC
MGRRLAPAARPTRGTTLPAAAPALLPAVLLLCGAALSAAQDSPLSNDYVVSNWQTEQGLPENSATSFVLSPDGHLWFGTFRGLVRFDGHKFIVFDQSRIPVLPDQGIVNLHRDRAGEMWISTLSGLVYGHEGSWTALGPQQGWTGTYVRHFANAGDGAVFVVTFKQQLFRFAGGRFTTLAPPPGRLDPTFIYADKAGQIRAVNRDFSSLWTPGGWQSEPLPKEIGQDTVQSWAVAQDGLLWVLRHDTLYKLDGSRLVSKVRLDQSVSNLWSLTEDSSGLLWACSSRLGLFRIRADGHVNRYSTATGLPSNGVRFVYPDQHGNRWIGTDGGGLVRIREKRLETIGRESGLPDFPVKAAAPGRDGRVFIATFGAGLFQFQDNRLSRLAVPGYKELYPQTLLVDRKGVLWLGGFECGLFQLREGISRQVLKPEEGFQNIESIFEDSHGRVWVSETRGKTARFSGDSVSRYDAPAQPRGISIRSIAEDRGSGAIWGAGDAGLFRFVEGRGFQPVTGTDGKPLPPLNTIFPLEGQGIWAAPATGGLVLWKDGKVVPLGSGQIPAAIVGGMLELDGHIWMATNRGVWRFRKADLLRAASGDTQPCEWQQFDRDDGLPSLECSFDHQPSIQADGQGRIWVPTLKGVAILDPLRLRLRADPVPARIEEVVYLARDGSQHRLPVEESEPVKIPPGSLDVHVLYTALDLSNQDKIRFAYTLSQDGTVVASGERTEREIVFAKLPPGEYRFGLRVRNADGYWNPSAVEIRLNREPFHWETGWFRAGIALFSLAMVTGVVLFGARRHSVKQLRRLSKEKTRAETEARLLHSTRMESIGRLAGGVAHDFNNLLTIVNGYSELLLLELEDDEEKRAKVENIHAAGQRAAELTRQLLAFSRSQAENLVPLDLNAVVRDTARLLQRLLGEGIQLELQLEEGIGCIMGDRAQLGQVLLNLVVNARDAMPDGGAVVIRTNKDLVEAGASSRNPGLNPGLYAVLSVEDNGVGMDPETIRHAFEPFYTTKPPGQGTGMGLAIVYGVVKRAGGRINVESQVGRGSRFAIHFPSVSAADVETGPKQEASRPDFQPATILLVEDDAAVRGVAARILTSNGYRVLEAGGGTEALALLERQEPMPDLLLSDVVMPGMSGFVLAERLAAIHPGLKVVFVSGYSGPAGEAASPDKPEKPTLRKPFTSSALLSTVHEALSGNGRTTGH